jgi:excisionase family DNA binding protein
MSVAVDSEQLLTTEQAAELLQVSASWLRKRTAAYAVPCVRLGRAVRFTRQNLADIVAANTRTPSP